MIEGYFEMANQILVHLQKPHSNNGGIAFQRYVTDIHVHIHIIFTIIETFRGAIEN